MGFKVVVKPENRVDNVDIGNLKSPVLALDALGTVFNPSTFYVAVVTCTFLQ